ncbi:MAG: arginase family protein [Candidatus Helarchaeota archaeon]
MKFPWANSSFEEADCIIIGVPDESGSSAARKGTQLGPYFIRNVSNSRDVYGPNRIAQSLSGEIKTKIFDLGDLKKEEVSKCVNRIVQEGKIPVTLGGDHSITTEILKGFPSDIEISLIYFDAHPDIISSKRHYFGSVIFDLSQFPNIDIDTSVEVGIRDPEIEEIINIRKLGLKTYTTYEIYDIGMKNVLKEIKNLGAKNIYLSIDMDVLDPAFAPGVGSPSPGGISAVRLMYLVKNIASWGKLVGVDIMETNPKFDIQDMTSHLAANILIEILAAIKLDKH